MKTGGAGADVRGERAHLDRHMVKSLISTIPSSIRCMRNPRKPWRLAGEVDLCADDRRALSRSGG